MVAKINRGEALYGAVVYNQQKVNEGTARIISGNRMITDVTNNPERIMQQTLLAFESYLLANKNTDKPILHISLNPTTDDKLSDAGFAALAKDYMECMGYGDQPYIVYLHEDITRRHIHIVSTCVDEQGNKISDKYEWNRSMKACRELEQKYGLEKITDKAKELSEAYLKKADYTQGDLKRQVSNTLKSVFNAYRYQSFGEFSAMLSCFNIEAKQVQGEHEGVPYNGIVYSVTDDRGVPLSAPIKSSLIDKRFGHEGLARRIRHNVKEFKEHKYAPKIRNEVVLAMHGCRGNRQEFARLLEGRGIGVVLRENDEGRIYGVTFIDHNAKEVYNGSRLGKEFSANVFNRLFSGGQEPEALSAMLLSPDEQGLSSADKESSIEQAFGIFDFEQHGTDPAEEAFARRLRRKKKQKRRSHNASDDILLT